MKLDLKAENMQIYYERPRYYLQFLCHCNSKSRV